MLGTVAYADSVTISGIIKNPADDPVKKAVVTLRNLKDEILMEETTNRKGKFTLKDVEPRFYYLVIEHEADGSKRIKINPRKKRNIDLILRLVLTGKDEPVECYLFANDNPTEFDPVLNVRDMKAEPSAGHMVLSWKDIKQAKLFTLYENDLKIYVGEDTRFEKDVPPGVEFCYTLKASGNFGLEGELSELSCASAPTEKPRDIQIDVYKNTFSFTWGAVEGAVQYALYRNDEKIGNIQTHSLQERDLKYDMDYYYKITALDALNIESEPSVEVKATTHEFIAAPILSSMNSESRITLIWNEVEGAVTYTIYRGGINISSTDGSSFTDPMPPGKQYCYEISCVDQYDIESDHSNSHCTKVPLAAPTGVQADGDVTSMHLNWNEVSGANYYKIYEKVNQDSMTFIEKVKSTQCTVRSLDFSADVCYVVTALDMDGEESDFSTSACNVVLEPPHFTIQNMTVIEPSGNGVIDAQETGSVQFALFNDGQSPAHAVVASVRAKESDQHLMIGNPIILDTLEAGRIKFLDISMEGALQVGSGENEFELILSSREKITLEDPYLFKVGTAAMIPPDMIVADFSISNDFNTHYIPKNEIVRLTIRIQNVGEGDTESVEVSIPENRSFTTPDFTGKVSLPGFNPGDYMDIEIPIMSGQDNFSVEIELTDYLQRTNSQRLDLETMRHYRSPMELSIQDLGAEDVVYYPDELGEIDVDRRIPLGRKNPNGMAIILATEYYDDKNYSPLEYAGRDRNIVRKYFNQAFGLSDFQLLPSKPWQMDGGPTGDDFRAVFDPHQGDLRKRIITAEKYSGVDEMDIFLYYRGYGEWIEGKPLLIPKDAKLDRHVTKYPLEQLVNNLSRLTVLSNIRTITLFLDITYINPSKSVGSLWDFPKLPEKMCILSASSNGETSQIFGDKKHSFFTYAFLKGLAGGADDGDNVIDLGEITEYIYKTVPEHVRSVSGSSRQNPKFNGMDLKRTVLDLR